VNRLIEVEIDRFTSRRLVRALAALVVLGILIAAPKVFMKSNRDIAAATVHDRQEAVRAYEECLRGDGHDGGPCESPNLDQIVGEPRFHLTQLVDIGEAIGGLLIMFSFVAGASFAGADWHHRVVTTTLTWEPRRRRVIGAKIAAVAAVTFAGAIVLELFLGAALTPAAIFRGTMAGIDGSWIASYAGVLARGGAMAAFAATIGCSIAMIGRTTAAALGGVFAWLVVGENLIRGGLPGWRRWLVGDQLEAFMGNPEVRVRSVATAGLLLALYGTLVVVVATRVFERRDVA
jgi:hypothetical protein